MAILREALQEDNERLLHFDRTMAETGTFLRVRQERKDYFSEARKYREWLAMVVEEGNEIVGTAGVGIKEVSLFGGRCRVGILFDVRIREDFRRSTSRAFVQMHRTVMRWMADRGVAFMYAYIKSDNKNSIRLSLHRGHRFFGRVSIMTIPVYRRKKVREDQFVREDDRIIAEVHREREHLPMFYDRQVSRDGQWGMSLAIGDETNYACCRVWDATHEKDISIQSMSPWLHAFSVASSAVARLMPLPLLHEPGALIPFWILADVVCRGKEGVGLLRQVIREVNNAALQQGVRLLLLPLNNGSNILRRYPFLLAPKFDYYIMGAFLDERDASPFGDIDLDPRDF